MIIISQGLGAIHRTQKRLDAEYSVVWTWLISLEGTSPKQWKSLLIHAIWPQGQAFQSQSLLFTSIDVPTFSLILSPCLPFSLIMSHSGNCLLVQHPKVYSLYCFFRGFQGMHPDSVILLPKLLAFSSLRDGFPPVDLGIVSHFQGWKCQVSFLLD